MDGYHAWGTRGMAIGVAIGDGKLPSHGSAAARAQDRSMDPKPNVTGRYLAATGQSSATAAQWDRMLALALHGSTAR